MKKILLATLEFPPMRGGIAEYLYGLTHALPRESIAVLMDSSAGAGAPPPTMFPLRSARLLDSPLYLFRWRRAIRQVAAAMRKERAEILAISHLLPMGYVALILKRLRGIPYIVFVHGTDLRFASRNAWKRFWARRVLKGASLVVANSRYTAGLAAKGGADPSRTEVVYPCPAIGLSAMEGEDESKHDMGVQGTRRMILSVGRLVHRKGFDRAIRALADLRRHCGDVVYVIVGIGPEREALGREAARGNVKPFVLFREGVTREKMRDFYGAADVLVAPGREVRGDIEGFGMVMLEASFHGLPVVTTAVGGAAEAVKDGETGIVLPEDASDRDLSDALCRLLADRKEARRLGENGRRRVREEFTWTTQAATLVARLRHL